MKRASYKGLAVDSLILTFVRIITAIVSIICYKLIATTFSLNEYGIYSQAMLVSTTVTSITILGLTDAINYFYNKEIDEKKNKRYVTTAFFSQFVQQTNIAIFWEYRVNPLFADYRISTSCYKLDKYDTNTVCI